MKKKNAEFMATVGQEKNWLEIDSKIHRTRWDVHGPGAVHIVIHKDSSLRGVCKVRVLWSKEQCHAGSSIVQEGDTQAPATHTTVKPQPWVPIVLKTAWVFVHLPDKQGPRPKLRAHAAMELLIRNAVLDLNRSFGMVDHGIVCDRTNAIRRLASVAGDRPTRGNVSCLWQADHSLAELLAQTRPPGPAVDGSK